MTTLNIRIRALEHNIEIIKSLAADAQIIAVLKGNAYGLGCANLRHSYRHAESDISQSRSLRMPSNFERKESSGRFCF